ncbi:hypothetical protein LCGC14_1761010 [marine sediment metagenome]|uniref:Uncharacterized protein n=1 Tax=marine sediment metagenome TaxID=412755 RepID=A0A0F9HNH7_9ZZZZ
MEQPKTPNCDKMLAVKDKSQVLTEFVDWLNHKEKGYHICQWFDETLEYASYGGYSKLFAEFFGIDYDEMEREKQAILTFIRAQQDTPDAS